MDGHPTASSSPFLVAHRAGNDLSMLRRADAQTTVRLVEADVHLFRGRMEVRHLKTVGPVNVLWDRWELASPRTARLLIERLLADAAPDTELMLDLKGRDPRLPGRLLDALAEAGERGRVTVCSRNWAFLEPLDSVPGVRVVHSVGSSRQLAALRRRFSGRRLEGISIHRKLLDAAVVADLRTRADLILTWPIADPDEARLIGGWGVDGVITERFDALAAELAAEAPQEVAA